jgi:hypothetical protein
MSEETDRPDPDETIAFAPKDYTDGRKVGEWKTDYPPQAVKEIRLEAIYVSLVFILYSTLVFVGLYYSAEGSAIAMAPVPTLTEPANSVTGQVATSAPSGKSGRWLPASFLAAC